MKISSEDCQKIKEEGCWVYEGADVNFVIADDDNVIRAKTLMVTEELKSRKHQPPSRYYLQPLD